jgi:hypothetical protein
MAPELSYRTKPDGQRWYWLVLYDGIVVMQGIAVTHAAAVVEAAEAVLEMWEAVLPVEGPPAPGGRCPVL